MLVRRGHAGDPSVSTTKPLSWLFCVPMLYTAYVCLGVSTTNPLSWIYCRRPTVLPTTKPSSWLCYGAVGPALPFARRYLNYEAVELALLQAPARAQARSEAHLNYEAVELALIPACVRHLCEVGSVSTTKPLSWPCYAHSPLLPVRTA